MSEETLTEIEHWPEPGLVREGLRLFKELSRTAPIEVLLATNLHAGNVLRSEREPWLVIDPKPFVGDPAYDATQHLFNCSSRLRSDPDGTIRRMADLLGLDRDQIRLDVHVSGVQAFVAKPKSNHCDFDSGLRASGRSSLESRVPLGVKLRSGRVPIPRSVRPRGTVVAHGPDRAAARRGASRCARGFAASPCPLA